MITFRFYFLARNVGLASAILFLTQCANSPQDAGLVAPMPSRLQVPSAKPKVGVFEIGDQLELFVKEDPSLNGSYLVREGGYIVIPRAGRIPVRGLTREEAEPKVRDYLQKTQLKEANVIVERTSSGLKPLSGSGSDLSVQQIMIYTTGSVARVGAHQIPISPGRSVGVYEALLISGGLGKFAKIDRVEVFRTDTSGKRKKAVINLASIMEGKEEDPPIAEGDIIHVPEKVFGF